jgi:3',5'-cyclic-AMP phosphodiesterase
MVLVQLSDPHIGATWAEGDPAARLAAAVDSVRSVVPKPDAVLVSGDLADHAADDEYRQVVDLLTPLAAPVYVVPGNHDDRAALRRHFALPGADGDPVLYAADLGALRLVVLDSTRPGEDAGELDEDRLSWLEATLASEPETPTLIAMHHPPLVTGVPVWDSMGLPTADRLALGEIVAVHPQVRRIVGGHLHRTISADLGGRSVLAVPSTYVQAQLDFRATEIELSTDPPGFAVHTLQDGALVSHVQPVG